MANQGIIKSLADQPKQEVISPFKQALSKSMIRIGSQLFENALENAHARGGRPADFDFSGVADDLTGILEQRWQEKEYENWMNNEFKPMQEEVDKVRRTISLRSNALTEGKVLDVNGNLIGEFDPNDQLALIKNGQRLQTEYRDIAAKTGENYVNSAMKYPTNPLIQQQVAGVFQRFSQSVEGMLGGAMENADAQMKQRLTEAQIYNLRKEGDARGAAAKDKEPTDIFDYMKTRGIGLMDLPAHAESSPEFTDMMLKSGGGADLEKSRELARAEILRDNPSLRNTWFNEGSPEAATMATKMAEKAPDIQRMGIGMFLEKTVGKKMPAEFESFKAANPKYFTATVQPAKKAVWGYRSDAEVENILAGPNFTDANGKPESIIQKGARFADDAIRTHEFSDVDEVVNHVMRTWFPEVVKSLVDEGSPGTDKTISKMEQKTREALRIYLKHSELSKERGVVKEKGLMERGKELLTAFGTSGGGLIPTAPSAQVPTSSLLPSEKKK